MKNPIEVTCIKCHLRFCCADCRWKHEQRAHGFTFDCPLCRGNRFLCHPDHLNQEFIEHLSSHLPLCCRKCKQTYETMQDFQDLNKCTTISDLVDVNKDDGVEQKFDSIYEKIQEADNFETSVNSSSKTAVIAPILQKHLLDYDSTDNEGTPEGSETPYPILPPKTPKIIRQCTPHIRKLRQHPNKFLVRQTAFNEDDEIDSDNVCVIINPTALTPSRNDLEVPDADQQITTPTTHLPHVAKLAQIVTTSTPTNPATDGWLLFPDATNDSPLSEIEIAESPSNQAMAMPKLKGIIVDSRRGSHDSIEKQVTFQDTNESSKKKVTFADGTIFNQEEPNVKRVYRKPKRMLTPGPQKPKRAFNNPHFKAILNRFENRVAAISDTPLCAEKSRDTPHLDYNVLARAISFKDSSALETSKDNELYSSCVEPDAKQAIAMLTAQLAGSLQTCLASALNNQDEETEIQFKFSITKKKLSVQRMPNDCGNCLSEKEGGAATEGKENIWSTVAKVVKKVFWGDRETSQRSIGHDSTSSSASKRRYEEISDDSPLNHKRRKFNEKIRGRPPIRANFDFSSLRSYASADNSSIIKQFSSLDESLNQSF